MGVAVTFVMALASMVTWAVDHYILTPLDLGYMQTAAFILIIAAIVQVVEMFLKKSVPTLYKSLGIYLPLITTNCAVLGVVLLNIQEHYNFLESLVYGFTGGLGFTLAIVLFSSVRQRVEGGGVPGELPGISHCSDFRGPFGSGIYGLFRPQDFLRRRANGNVTTDWCGNGSPGWPGRLLRPGAGNGKPGILCSDGPPSRPAGSGPARANCGGCGFSGCGAYAQAVLDGKAPVGLCVSGGDACAQTMASVMGVKAEKGGPAGCLRPVRRKHGPG